MAFVEAPIGCDALGTGANELPETSSALADAWRAPDRRLETDCGGRSGRWTVSAAAFA
jgi:hypothetical protein